MIKRFQYSNSQLEFLSDKTQYSGFSGSYKAGKTYIGVRKCLDTQIVSKLNGLIAEPNYRMSEDILKPVLESALRDYGIQYHINESDNIFETENGNILIRTMEKRSALEGHNLNWFYCDEIDLLPESKANEVWRVLLSKLTLGNYPRGFVSGTNEGYSFLYKKFTVGASVEIIHDVSEISKTNFDRTIYTQYYKDEFNNDTNVVKSKLFVSPIFENEINLPQNYILNLMADYDEKLIERYLLGKFVNIQSGKAYYSFSEYNLTDTEFSPTADTFISWDVNYSDRMMATSLIQKFGANDFPYADSLKDVYVVTKFFGNKDTNTETQCKIIDEFLQKNKFTGTLKEYGDRVGLDRRVGAALSHYEITKGYFGKYAGYSQNFRPTKSIADRLASVNRLFNNSVGFKQLYINKNQTLLIEDLEQVVWKSNGKELDNGNIIRTDASDSLSYYCYYEHDIAKSDMKWN